ncbi:zf-TFIIB domain-containing protein [Thermoproteus tenax]|nr:zf-TFIIB domain-containing protein [Thermoproteus tenax]
MARRYCPVCKRAVEEEIVRRENLVIKRCPNCGHVFAQYEVRRAAAK